MPGAIRAGVLAHPMSIPEYRSLIPPKVSAARSHSDPDALPVGITEPAPDTSAIQDVASISLRREILWLLVILAVGLLPRLAFAHSFPSQPISDFRSLLNFAMAFQADWLARNAEQWRLLSPGLPFFLSLLLRVIPRSPESVGRLVTVILTGLVPVLPYVLWRGAFRLRTRVLAGMMLALWPGQILFSSVLAQDNWVIFPSVALVALAARLMEVPGKGRPILAGVLYASAVAIREEMLIILLPVVVLAAVGTQPEKRVLHALVGGLTAVLLLGALVVQRGAATGRYTLFTEHLGASVLGAYVPGAGLVWVYPVPFVEAVKPGLLESNASDKELNQAEVDLAWQEFLRRPTYHTMRILGTTLLSFFEMDKAVTSWSLSSPGVMPQELRKDALAFRNTLRPILVVYPLLLQALFASSIYFAIGRRSLLVRISPMLIPIFLKIGLHVVVVSQARYFLVVAALEILTIAVISDKCFEIGSRKVLIRSLLLGALSVLVLFVFALSARDYVLQHMEPAQVGYHPSPHVASTVPPEVALGDHGT